jgi:hypothetical protein
VNQRIFGQKAERHELKIQANRAIEEAIKARKTHGPMAGAHEAYAIILEELDEFWDSVRADRPDPEELVQVAAMCLCALVELDFKNRGGITYKENT